MTQTPKTPPPTKEDIYRQLQRVLSSPDFNASAQQTAVLKFVVEQTLSGNAAGINETAIAANVFGRGPDFDQSIDPVVSIQASLLRRALERYYSKVGINDPIRISISEETYLPEFE